MDSALLASLIAYLLSRKGAPIGRVVCETFPLQTGGALKYRRGTLAKDRGPDTACPWPGLRRLWTGVFQIPLIATWQNKNNNALWRYGEAPVLHFTSDPIWGGAGQHVAECPYLIRHKSGSLYLALCVPTTGQAKTVSRWFDGERELTPDEIATLERDFLKPPSPSAKQSHHGLPEDRHNQFRTIKVQNVVSLHFENEVWNRA